MFIFECALSAEQFCVAYKTIFFQFIDYDNYKDMIFSISKNANFTPAVLIATIFIFCLVSTLTANAQVNQRDETGLRQGPWQGTHPNGRVRYTGQFVDNKPIGTFKHFNPDGSARLNLYHELHNDTVKAVFFHRNGQNLATGQFLHQKRTGLWTYYSQSGQKLSENSYLNGQMHGAFLIFFPSGAISERIDYVEGRKEGMWNQYFENGMLRLEANYMNDMLHGAFTAYHSNGIALVRAEFYENLPHNQKFFFTSTGEKIREQEFNKGVLVSERVFIHIADEPTVPLEPSNDPILEMIRSGIH